MLIAETDEEDKGFVNNLRESSNPVPDQGNPWESWAQVFTIGALALVEKDVFTDITEQTSPTKKKKILLTFEFKSIQPC